MVSDASGGKRSGSPRGKRAATQARLPVQPEDLMQFRIVSDPQIAPDGRRIVFVEKHVGERNDYVCNLWMTSADRRSAPRSVKPFTRGCDDTLPRWSPDGRTIAFARKTGGQSQVFLIDAGGGEARQVSRFVHVSVHAIQWSPDGRWLLVRLWTADPEWTDSTKRERESQGLTDPPRVIESLSYRHDGHGYTGGRRDELHVLDIASGKPRLIYGEDGIDRFSFDLSPDGKYAVVATNRQAEPTLHPEKDELLRINVTTGRAAPVPRLPPGPKSSVCWSSDGRTLAYAGRIGRDPLYSPENAELFVCDAWRGEARSLTAEVDVCVRAEGIADTAVGTDDPALRFSPDGRRLYMRLNVRGESHIASVSAAGGKLAWHTRGAVDVRMGNFSADGRAMAVTVGTAVKLSEVAVLDCGNRKKNAAWRLSPVTDLNGPLLAGRRLARPRRHWIRAADGHRIQVWMIKPPAVEGARKRPTGPAVLEVHGGPHAQYGSTFFHEFQVLAAAGYTVFYSNPRGSKGYGRDHCAAIRGRWGTADWTDLKAVIAFMKQQPHVDVRRMGVIGGSYGGYMTNWAISHCDDFAAAVTDRCLSNLISGTANMDVIEPVSQYFPGNFWDQPEERWDQSPMKYIGNVKTPTLIIHSEGDLRCNIEQSEQLFAALKLLGVPARFVRYPANTSHGMSRTGPPDVRIHRLRQILNWWSTYLAQPTSRRKTKSSQNPRAVVCS